MEQEEKKGDFKNRVDLARGRRAQLRVVPKKTILKATVMNCQRAGLENGMCQGK